MTLLAASLLVVFAGVNPGYAQHKGHSHKKTTAKKVAKTMYKCKMCHTKSAKAGNCPKCGMPMTKMGGMEHSHTGKMNHSSMSGMDKKK